MVVWARLCPSNCRNKQLLLEAEVASLVGNFTRALTLFKQSVQAAQLEKFHHEEGLSCERLAQYYLHIGLNDKAGECFSDALDAYKRWGAHTLVERMEDKLRSLSETPS